MKTDFSLLGKTYRENPVFITGMGLQCRTAIEKLAVKDGKNKQVLFSRNEVHSRRPKVSYVFGNGSSCSLSN